jgi:hypothetical protein
MTRPVSPLIDAEPATASVAGAAPDAAHETAETGIAAGADAAQARAEHGGAPIPTAQADDDGDPGATAEPMGAGRRAGRRRGRIGLWVLLSLPLVLVAFAFLLLLVSHQPLPAPQWLVARMEARANVALQGALTVHLRGGADLVVDEGITPRIRLHVVEIARPNGMPVAVFPELRMTLHAQPLLRGKIEPRSFRIRGAGVALRRKPDGSLDIELGGALALSGAGPENAAEAVKAFQAAFATPALRKVESIEADALELRVDDARLGRVWRVSNGNFRLTQEADRISVALGLDIGAADKVPASVALSTTIRKDSLETSFNAAVSSVASGDLALQSPALAWLSVLDAPISGTLRSGIDADGKLKRLDAALEIDAGVISPVPGVPPVPFNSGRVSLSYDTATARVTFTDLALDSRALRLQAEGSATLKGLANGLPQALLGQVSIKDLQVDPAGLFVTPARFSQGAVDLRLQLNPFTLDIGQAQLVEGGRRISAQGQIAADAKGWRVSLDAGVDAITRARLLALWPPALVPKTRDWIAQNVMTGELRQVKAALRLAPGEEPRLALGYDFSGAEVRVIKTLPPVEAGSGFATIEGNTQTLVVERGHVTAPQGGSVDVADTVMIVPDIRQKPAMAEVRMHARSSIPAVLSLLDEPPFKFLSKAGQPVDIAEGQAETRADLFLPLVDHLRPNDVTYKVTAALSNVSSSKVVPGRVVTAEHLQATVTPAGIVIEGPGLLSGVPVTARWQQDFGPAAQGHSTLAGTVEISPAALDAFAIGLPKGSVSGTGVGKIALVLDKDKPVRFTLSSDLVGVGLRVPEIGWSKAAATPGKLELAGAFGKPATVDRVMISAPGLDATGKVQLTAEGGLDSATFENATVGRWFKGAGKLIGRGQGRALDVDIASGTLDLRNLPASMGGGGAQASGGSTITARLSRVSVADDLMLGGMQGSFTTRGGFSGRFTGKVNGQAPVEGTVAPDPNGRAAVRIQAEDAGAVLNASGIFSRARGGKLDLVLHPTGNDGQYDGTASIRDIRVKDAPVLAAMLGAASGIGLLEQLSGEGLVFNEVEGAFRLTPEAVSITRGSATGASLGVTLTGLYRTGTEPGSGKLDMQGVVSPLYLINGIGELLTRRGEGVFGFTYRLTGTAARPEISVNPLSLLTPGMLRDIFRREPPKIGTDAATTK